MKSTVGRCILSSFSLLLLVACSGAEGQFADDGPAADGQESASETKHEPLYYQAEYLWPRNYFGKTEVTVCWLNEAGSTEAGWIKAAVERSWEVASGIDFVGWDDCDNHRTTASGVDVYDADVRIRVSSDYGGGSSNVGTEALNSRSKKTSESEDVVASMRLNWFTSAVPGFAGCDSTKPTTGPTGKSWSSARRECIESIAVHEFGHAAGLAHEQNRPDTPASCTADNDGYGDTTMGAWDQVSVMNYCTAVWNNDGYLSAFDVSGMQRLYGAGSIDYLWYLTGNAKDLDPNKGDGFYFDLRKQNITGKYSRPFSGDFDGDGEDDIFWYAPGTDTDSIWFGKTSRSFDTGHTFDVDGTYVPVVGRFNGDTLDDIYWYGSGSNADHIWFGKSDGTFDTSVKAKAFSRSGSFQPFSGDFDGDGHSDIFWYQPGSGADYIWWGSSGSGSFTEVTTDVTGTFKPLVGDFDADGRSDIMWYGIGSTTSDYTWWGRSDRSFTPDPWGSVSGDYEPIVGDFDGNGASDIYWDRGETNDPVWLGQVGKRTPRGFKSDMQGDYRAIVGDYDGNGKDDIFWYGQDPVVQ